MQPAQQPAWVVAVLAGVFSFISPCVLPLIPGYLSMISGLTMEELEERRAGHLVRIFFSCLLFSLGFSIVFIFVGLSVGTIGQWLTANRVLLNVIFGIIVIAFGLFVVGVVRLPFLYQDRRLRVSRGSLGLWGAPVLGFAFGFGWTPCIGPILGSILIYTSSTADLRRGLLLLFVYSLGLAIPFLVAAWALEAFLRWFQHFRRYMRWVERIAGAVLVVVGVLMLSGSFTLLSGWMQKLTPTILRSKL